MRKRKLASLILICSVCLTMLTGCLGSRTIFILPGTVAVTTEWTKDVKVAAPDKDGNLVVTEADLPPGTAVKVPKEEGR